MMNICDADICTGCAACRVVCPKSCITMQPDELGAMHPCIDVEKCVECGLCHKTCPNNSTPSFHHPMEVYAAWSNDKETRRTSASGGFAAEVYHYCINHNIFCAGVELTADSCRFIQVSKLEDITKVQNSKYVFSDTNGIYKEIKTRLANSEKVVFIGLPCQVAGLYSYLGKEYEGLTTIDIICHGVAPFEYFKQHLHDLKLTSKNSPDTISFRDPYFKTGMFFLSFRRNSKLLYAKKARSTDAYQLGYHRALIYRENCYKCNFARQERVADLTIGDFSGLGTRVELCYPKENISCLIINTEMGLSLKESLVACVKFDKRPYDEAFKEEKQLQHPSVPHFGRNIFVQTYKSSKSFKKATDKTLRRDRFDVIVRKGLWKQDIKSILRKIIPAVVITTLKKI